jgi:hypothetical protein
MNYSLLRSRRVETTLAARRFPILSELIDAIPIVIFARALRASWRSRSCDPRTPDRVTR